MPESPSEHSARGVPAITTFLIVHRQQLELLGIFGAILSLAWGAIVFFGMERLNRAAALPLLLGCGVLLLIANRTARSAPSREWLWRNPVDNMRHRILGTVFVTAFWLSLIVYLPFAWFLVPRLLSSVPGFGWLARADTHQQLSRILTSLLVAGGYSLLALFFRDGQMRLPPTDDSAPAAAILGR
jgi:hypothetical protein